MLERFACGPLITARQHTTERVERPMHALRIAGLAGDSDGLVRLPMAGSVSSLNVSVATGVCLFEAMRQRGAKAAASRK